MTPADFAGLVVTSVAVQVLAAGLGAALVLLVAVAWYRERDVPAALAGLPMALVGLTALVGALVSLSGEPTVGSVSNAIANRLLLPVFGGPVVLLTLAASVFEGARHKPRSLVLGATALLGGVITAGVVIASGAAVPAVSVFAQVRGAAYAGLGLGVLAALAGNPRAPTAASAGGTAALAFGWAVVMGETSQRALIELMVMLQLPQVPDGQEATFVERALEVVQPAAPYSAVAVALGMALCALSLASAARSGRFSAGLATLLHLPLMLAVYALGHVDAAAFVAVGTAS